MAEIQEDYSKEDAQRTQSWANMLAALSDKSFTPRSVKLGEPSGGKFTYPIHKRRTQENTEALRKSEHNLDAFWASIDQLMVAKAGDLRNTAVRSLLSQPRILQRTPEWTEPEKASAAALAPNPGESDRYAINLPVSAIYSGISPRQLDVAPPKQKSKTRRKPNPASVGDTEVESRGAETKPIQSSAHIPCRCACSKSIPNHFLQPCHDLYSWRSSMEWFPPCDDFGRVCCHQVVWFGLAISTH
ncbi:hypothetical protein N7509_006879 [Penicillium cosmopolitanum]|uniref:Uncharacterized protein n=1 Tax=Penicillium cosmopolitanum TaxID=1131564 RepID=A0A9W9VXV6_9EURO|nr:uncharacterized protein N7509_006879 [Penicillium cosmopolitanum]KAJ5391389.1 hypothetical protein N7509_006879 [Penicillium cosmopolitanum]